MYGLHPMVGLYISVCSSLLLKVDLNKYHLDAFQRVFLIGLDGKDPVSLHHRHWCHV